MRSCLASNVTNRIICLLIIFSCSIFTHKSSLAVADEIAQIRGVEDISTSAFSGSNHELILDSLSNVQIENLALLAKIWGFLKYHHPLVTAGRYDWDGELFLLLPRILQAPTKEDAQDVIHHWIALMDSYGNCELCVTLQQDELALSPNLAWISSPQLSLNLIEDLKKIYRNRPSNHSQYYVAFEKVGNPVFTNENHYRDLQFPSSYHQLLALFRLWNIIEYWSPYRELTTDNWDDVLKDSIREFALAHNVNAYRLALIKLTTKISDSHTKLYSSTWLIPPSGTCALPIEIRFIENQAVVASISNGSSTLAVELNIGDVVDGFDDKSITELLASYKPFYAASNPSSQIRDIGTFMTRGECKDVVLHMHRDQDVFDINVKRVPIKIPLYFSFHEKAGKTFQMLNNETAYLKLSTIKTADINSYLESAKNSKGLIVDLRGYPSEFVVFSLARHFVERSTEFSRFSKPDVTNPGAFKWTPPVTLLPLKPFYEGKVVILVDETSQSQAEYTAMALRASPKAIIVGSTTAGTDGDISSIPLPGTEYTYISGLGVFYPNKRQTQQVGIIPDIEVKPSIKGIRAGIDEQLDVAIKLITSSETN